MYLLLLLFQHSLWIVMVTSATRKLSLCVADVTINSASYSPVCLSPFSRTVEGQSMQRTCLYSQKEL